MPNCSNGLTVADSYVVLLVREPVQSQGPAAARVESAVPANISFFALQRDSR